MGEIERGDMGPPAEGFEPEEDEDEPSQVPLLRQALRISTKSQFLMVLTAFGGECLRNGYKNEVTAPNARSKRRIRTSSRRCHQRQFDKTCKRLRAIVRSIWPDVSVIRSLVD